jgi:hypothetical protein
MAAAIITSSRVKPWSQRVVGVGCIRERTRGIRGAAY